MSELKAVNISPAVAPADADLRAQRTRHGLPLGASAAQNVAHAIAMETPPATAQVAFMQIANPRVENWLHRAS